MDESRVGAIELFAALNKRERREIARCADEVDVREGKRLVAEGDFAYEFFVIEQGSAEVLRGGEHVADLGPGDFMGEMGIMEHATRNASVVAKSDMTVVVLTRQSLRSITHTMPAVARRLISACDERGRSLAGHA